MMKPFLVAAALAAWLSGGNGQGLSPEDIAAAIEQGKAGKKLEKKCTGKNDNSFDIVAEGPIGRIMRAAKEAARRKQDFTAADVTPLMAGSWITVTATRVEALRKNSIEDITRDRPGYRYQTEFVIKSKGSGSGEATILKPIGPIRYEHDNSSVRTVISKGAAPDDVLSRIPLEGAGMAASFDLEAFRAIPSKDVEIYVFMTDTGGHGCKINDKERQALK